MQYNKNSFYTTHSTAKQRNLLYILDIDAIIGLDPAGPIFETNSIGKWFQNTTVALQKSVFYDQVNI